MQHTNSDIETAWQRFLRALPLPASSAVAPFNSAIRDFVPRKVSCGCCAGGCVCWNHQDTPRGVPPATCAAHKETPLASRAPTPRNGV